MWANENCSVWWMSQEKAREILFSQDEGFNWHTNEEVAEANRVYKNNCNITKQGSVTARQAIPVTPVYQQKAKDVVPEYLWQNDTYYSYKPKTNNGFPSYAFTPIVPDAKENPNAYAQEEKFYAFGWNGENDRYEISEDEAKEKAEQWQTIYMRDDKWEYKQYKNNEDEKYTLDYYTKDFLLTKWRKLEKSWFVLDWLTARHKSLPIIISFNIIPKYKKKYSIEYNLSIPYGVYPKITRWLIGKELREAEKILWLPKWKLKVDYQLNKQETEIVVPKRKWKEEKPLVYSSDDTSQYAGLSNSNPNVVIGTWTIETDNWSISVSHWVATHNTTGSYSYSSWW